MTYKSKMFVSADNERIMSSFTLLDSNLNQASMPDRVQQMVIIHKESSSWKSFDSNSALTIWRKEKPRKANLPPIRKQLFDPRKFTIKTISVIKEAHEKRLLAWKKKFVTGEGTNVTTDVQIDSEEEIVSDSEPSETTEVKEEVEVEEAEGEGNQYLVVEDELIGETIEDEFILQDMDVININLMQNIPVKPVKDGSEEDEENENENEAPAETKPNLKRKLKKGGKLFRSTKTQVKDEGEEDEENENENETPAETKPDLKRKLKNGGKLFRSTNFKTQEQKTTTGSSN